MVWKMFPLGGEKKKSRLHANIDQSWIKRSYIIFQSLLDLQGYKQGE